MISIKQTGKSLSRNRAEAIDMVLSFLFLSENQDRWDWVEPYCESQAISRGVEKFNRLPLTHFDGADISLMYESLHGTTSYERLFFAPDLAELRDLRLDRWDTCMAGFFNCAKGEEERRPGYLFTLQRHRKIPLREVRGLFRLRSSEVIEYSRADVYNDGTYSSFREYYQFFSGAWHCVGVPFEVDPPERMDDEEARNTVWMSKSIALTKEYDWAVHLGFNKASVPTVSIPTDPAGAKEVFRLRDVPPGKSRRDALRHWVSAHMRRTPAAEGYQEYMETQIWPYLRGAEEFTWNGLYCKIEPSLYDLKKAEQFRQIREQQKKQARHV